MAINLRPQIVLSLAFMATIILGLNEKGLAQRAVDRKAPPMNVVFILVDDLGWSDLGCFGSDFFETPQIDAFAQKSLLFTNAYAAAPVCSPTRAAIMTGKFPARLDMTIWHEGAVDGGPKDRKLLAAPAQPNLPLEEITLAEVFRQAGYFTAHLGKWHLGTAAFYPEAQGFDVNIGGTFWGAPATFFHPYRGPWRNDDPELRYVPGLAKSKAGDYLSDKISDEAIEVIRTAKTNGDSFFLSLWFYTVHSPIQAPQNLIDKYRKKTGGKVHKDPTYAAMVERMDYNVGRVLDSLRKLDLAENTIVIFTSDNGGVDIDQRGIVPTNNAPLRSGKGTLYEGGLRVPMIVNWPGVTNAGKCAAMVSSQDYYRTLVDYLSAQSDVELKQNRDVDGESLLPVLTNPDRKLDRKSLYWHYPHYYSRMTPGSALRHENWKLIHYYEDDRAELFDLASDPGEANNLVDTQSTVAERLRVELDEWRALVGANRPTINSRF